MKDKNINIEGYDKFLNAELNDFEDNKVKMRLLKNNDPITKRLDSFKQQGIANKESYFEFINSEDNKQWFRREYIFGIAASVLLFLFLGINFFSNSDKIGLEEWNSMDSLDRINALNLIDMESTKVDASFLSSLYLNEDNLNVRLKLIDCMSFSNSQSISISELLSKESSPLAELQLRRLNQKSK